MTIPFLRNTYTPVQGQTYSLFDGITTYKYFRTIESIIDKLLIDSDLNSLLQEVRKQSQLSFTTRVIQKANADRSIQNEISDLIFDKLSAYTSGTENHLKQLSRFKLREKVVWTTEKQHHLFMLEIGILNRINLSRFKNCQNRIALLPYCLRDENLECKSIKKDFEKVCVNCSTACLLGVISSFLKKHKIEAYLWSGKSLKPLFKQYRNRNESIGVLGIACIPELREGMKKVSQAGIPVIGHPLNANRCPKWMGKMHQTNTDLVQLEELLEKKCK
ncbi:MAG: DUF116 domain-containing protein [Bacteroidetes bacterium]|mgnify:CR=1 FL=1|jgi:hypothetical protein|nr:DUF116 domain-containing protein [Bacteroidota bacterium]MBT5528067.1 DUF116 domain-containing protein [Cytophagia bacterium]MBT3424333.1 DUF116 domain-containing protein [Bacteroidota bacterium]MBT3801916.1 DUF116 domain-containing protein [Bacteroidota bacterium]MBT3934188.1 DUF116 domain-containing protein [Bacteroidota bacterium]